MFAPNAMRGSEGRKALLTQKVWKLKEEPPTKHEIGKEPPGKGPADPSR